VIGIDCHQLHPHHALAGGDAGTSPLCGRKDFTMKRPVANKRGYRGIQFGVHRAGENDWRWAYYPTAGTVVAERGKVKGTREMAVKACKAAIDKLLGPQT
jgi:hypothetical protein